MAIFLHYRSRTHTYIANRKVRYLPEEEQPSEDRSTETVSCVTSARPSTGASQSSSYSFRTRTFSGAVPFTPASAAEIGSDHTP
jgi:hypothetical protein